MENFLDKYSEECKKVMGPVIRLFPTFELQLLNAQSTEWAVKGKIGNFQWRSLGAVFPNTELMDGNKAQYNAHYEQCAQNGCIHAAFLVMQALSQDPEFKLILRNDYSLNIIVANTQSLQSNSTYFPVLNEFVMTLQQNMSVYDDDVFKVNAIDGLNVSLSIDSKIISKKIIILPLCYTNTDSLRGYAQLGAALMQGGAKCVLAVSFLHLMPNQYGQEEYGSINLPMPRGRGYSFSELADMF